MMGKAPFSEGRPGKRDPKKLRQEIMRRAMTNANNSHGLGGRKKEGAHAPRPITLPGKRAD